MKKKLSLLIVAFMALAAYAGLNAWRTAGETKSLTVDFEEAASEYTDWSFTNIVTKQTNSGVNAHGGSFFGSTNSKESGSIVTKEKIANPKSIQFFVSKTSTNTTASSWLVEVSTDGENWTQVGDAQSASVNITKGTWTEVNRDLSAYKNVFVRISYKGTSAIRTIDDVTLSYAEESGEGETGETKTVYLKPGVWNSDGARFAAYLFKGEENTWVDFSSTPGADGSTGTYFKADIPVSYTTMILVRMKSGTTENNWDNKWNQTDDIDITELADKTLYRITGWGSGSNSPYDTTTWPEQSTDPDPQPEQVTWTVAGSNEALFGTAWAPALEANDMTLEDGVYKWEKENVTLLAGDVEFKVVKNHSWDEGSYPEGSNNYVQSIEVGGFYTFTITFNAETKDIRVAAVKTGGISTIGELNALADKTAFTFFGDAVVVAKPTAKYVYIADERGGSLIYDKNSVGTAAAEVGKTIATPWSGTVSIYNGLFEAIPTAALAVKDGEAVPVTYQEVDATYLTADNVNKVVKLKGLTITAIDGKYITFKQGDADVAGYNQFGLQLSADQVGKTYDVVGAIGRYNDKIQFQPISMEEVATPVTINSMAIVGELTGGWPDTETGDWSMAKEMTKSADNPNIWTLSVAEFEAEAKEYNYKATANGKYGDYELPAEGNKTYTFTEAGKYSLLFTADTEKHELTLEAKKIETEVTYTVAGAFYYVKDGDTDATEVAIFGGEKGWDPTITANDMVKGDDGIYTYKKEDVEFVAAGNVQLKVVKDHSFDVASYPEKNKEITIAAAGKYDVVVTFNPETKEVTATATSKDAPAEDTYTAVGVKALWGVNDWTVDKSNNLTKGDDGKYTITKTDLTLNAGNYGYKVVKNGTQWMPDGEGNEKKLAISERAVYSVTLTLDPTAETEYVATASKTGEAEPVVDTYTVAGAFYYVKDGDTDATEVIIFGGDKSWDPSLTANDMTKGEDNLYHFKKEDVELVAAGNVQLKVVKDHSFDVASYPEKNKEITIAAAGKYDIEVTFNPETKEVTATATPKTTPEPATISKVEIRGGIGGDWDKKPIQLTLAPGDPNVYYAVLDATEFTEDFEFKMLVNGDAESETDKIWLGFKEMTLTDPNKWVTPKKEEFGSNLNFANSTSGYQTYHFKAKWTPSAVASAGWELQITEGDPRTAPAPELIVLGNNAEIFGKAWDTESTTNTMELIEGKYYRTYKNVKPQETAIELKAYNKTNGKWFGNKKDGDNVKFNMKAEGDFTVVLDVNADFTEGNVEVTGDNVEMIYPEPEQPVEDATIEKVQLLGDWNWDAATDNITLTKGEGNVWTGVLDLTETVEDQKFKLVVNGGGDESDNWKGWIGTNNLTVNAPEGWAVSTADATNANCTLNNSKTGYKTYDITATWTPSADYAAGWTLTIAGKDERGETPDAEITSVQLPGDWNWALDKGADDVEPYLVLTKGEDNTWTGVLDLTEVTTDQEFKLNVNKDNANWLGVGELKLDAGELVSTEKGEGNNFILKNADSGFQTYNVTATWEANASAKNGWTLTIAGKDERPVVTEPVYTLVGAFYDGEGKESASFFGESWKVLEANNLEKISDGFYKKEYTGINLEKGDVSLKVLKDGDWEHPYPNADGYLLNIPSAGVYDLTFTFDPDQSVVRGEADKKSEPIEITRMDIVGDFTGGWPNAETGDWSMAKAMTQDATNPAIWTLTVEGFKAEAKTYEYKATANGQYGVYELPASGNNNWVFGTEAYPAGKYDLLFTANTADNSLTVVPTLTEVETVILDEEETLAENQVLEVDEPFTSDEITVEDGQIITIEADEAGESLVPRRAFRALAASDITIQYKPEAGSGWQDAPVTVETNETGYQFEVTGAVATAINDLGFAIKANKPIVVTQVAVVTEVTPDPEPEPVYYAVGVKALWGVNDWTVDEANKLTLNGEGKYTITKTELTLDANTNYGYKVVKKVGDTQYWIPDGMGTEKNLTVTERAVYSVTLTLDPAEPLTAESFTAVATKTGEAEPAPDAEITKVEIRGSFNGWDTPDDGLVMAKQGETNTYTATLDLTEITEDVQFKLVLNNKVDWLGWGELELVAPENWTAKEDGTGNNIVLKNATTGFKTYTLTATWTPGPVAKTGWKLEIVGKDERPAVPATITKVELRGEFTSWSDGEGVELTKQGETDTYAGVLDLSEITADQAFKLVINDKTYWIDFNHLSLVAPDGWLVKESGEVTEPAIILTNSSTGYKTYDITATWTPSPNAAAGWTLTVAGKDLRPVAEDTYTVFGAFYDGDGEHASILTKTWDPTATENDMVKGDGNVYTKTYADAELTAGTFQLKVAKNHNDATSYPEGYGVNYELPIAAAGKYDVVVTFNADTKEVTAVATPKEPAPEANYYIVGSMTDWQTKEAYKLTVNEAAEGGVVEYMITIDLAKDDQFKIAKSDDGIHVYDADWYPTGMDNNYKITKTSNYTVYFRPNYDGGEGWHYGCIYAVDNNPTGINGVKADALKDAEVYTINGQRVQNPTKGLYIVNGRKVVIK